MKEFYLSESDFVIVMTGAGISAESGIKTFRDSDGLWENHRVEDVATPEAFKKDPKLVWNFYKQRYFQAKETSPNEGHYALVKLENILKDRFLLVTQNVDGLHSRAGSRRLIEMHGSLNTCLCVSCQSRFEMQKINLDKDIPLCPVCKKYLRPDIVWFGEIPYCLDEIDNALNKVTVFISIGTSGQVYPAAQFIAVSKYNGAKTIGVNLASPENKSYMDYFYQGKSGELLPGLVDKWTSKL